MRNVPDSATDSCGMRLVKAAFTYSDLRLVTGCVRTTGCSDSTGVRRMLKPFAAAAAACSLPVWMAVRPSRNLRNGGVRRSYAS
jgi:hypothetical protein